MTKTSVAVLGIDLGKSSCSLAGLDAAGAVIMRRRMPRKGTFKFVAALPACVIAMEACCGAHFLGRVLVQIGSTDMRVPDAPYNIQARSTASQTAGAVRP